MFARMSTFEGAPEQVDEMTRFAADLAIEALHISVPPTEARLLLNPVHPRPRRLGLRSPQALAHIW
jgi:hypothetical protein